VPGVWARRKGGRARKKGCEKQRVGKEGKLVEAEKIEPLRLCTREWAPEEHARQKPVLIAKRGGGTKQKSFCN